jgi:hypothetical protein
VLASDQAYVTLTLRPKSGAKRGLCVVSRPVSCVSMVRYFCSWREEQGYDYRSGHLDVETFTSYSRRVCATCQERKDIMGMVVRISNSPTIACWLFTFDNSRTGLALCFLIYCFAPRSFVTLYTKASHPILQVTASCISQPIQVLPLTGSRRSTPRNLLVQLQPRQRCVK